MIIDKFRLDGKLALVTGSSSGLGQAIAIALAEAGADVACHCRTTGPPTTTIAAITKTARKALDATGPLSDESPSARRGDIPQRAREG